MRNFTILHLRKLNLDNNSSISSITLRRCITNSGPFGSLALRSPFEIKKIPNERQTTGSRTRSFSCSCACYTNRTTTNERVVRSLFGKLFATCSANVVAKSNPGHICHFDVRTSRRPSLTAPSAAGCRGAPKIVI